jgi:hypothetical protein
MMGVSQNVYTVYGVKVDYDNSLSDLMYEGDQYAEFEKIVIADGMGGEYMVIGAILFDSGDARWEPMEGFAEIDITDLPGKQAEVREQFTRLAEPYARLLDAPWKLMTFVHYH